jgi:hypothetical protein
MRHHSKVLVGKPEAKGHIDRRVALRVDFKGEKWT